MAAPTHTLFQTAVENVLNGWTVLQLAVSHGFGGAESREKADWMVYAVDQWFQENSNIETFELEDFLADVLDHEFDTVADDGSLPEVARLICGFYRLCQAGDESQVRQKLSQLPRAKTHGSIRSQEVPDMDESNSAQAESQSCSANSSTGASFQSQQNTESMNVEMEDSSRAEEEEVMEDGWQVVQRGKRR
ncbi:hypothetical protein CHS0354_030285 [Potamilus streckersoni]|uniref:Pre-rRNA-processing protein TSR2 homolog n=1 Tax=Potamilus streckersoni TaxID=2493646 RepID=A0AAE0VKL7_9BIVA|nr:hypothetical protein CHS0354_030285 [Potamilus streckersoni]